MHMQAMGAFLAFSSATGSGILCLATATVAALTYAFIGIVVVAGIDDVYSLAYKSEDFNFQSQYCRP